MLLWEQSSRSRLQLGLSPRTTADNCIAFLVIKEASVEAMLVDMGLRASMLVFQWTRVICLSTKERIGELLREVFASDMGLCPQSNAEPPLPGSGSLVNAYSLTSRQQHHVKLLLSDKAPYPNHFACRNRVLPFPRLFYTLL